MIGLDKLSIGILDIHCSKEELKLCWFPFLYKVWFLTKIYVYSYVLYILK